MDHRGAHGFCGAAAVIGAMRGERAGILTGIKAYLRTHFPDVEFTAVDDIKTNGVLFHGDGRPRYRLAVTERFLNAEDGVDKSLSRLDEWETATVLRAAKSKLVTLATTGLHTSERYPWPVSSVRRQS